MNSIPNAYVIRRYNAGASLTGFLANTTLKPGTRARVNEKLLTILADQGPTAAPPTRFQFSEQGMYDPKQIKELYVGYHKEDRRLRGIGTKQGRLDADKTGFLGFTEDEVARFETMVLPLEPNRAPARSHPPSPVNGVAAKPTKAQTTPAAKQEPATAKPKTQAKAAPKAPATTQVSAHRPPRPSGSTKSTSDAPQPAKVSARDLKGRLVYGPVAPQHGFFISRMFDDLRDMSKEKKAQAFDRIVGVMERFSASNHEAHILEKEVTNKVGVVMARNLNECNLMIAEDGTVTLKGYKLVTRGFDLPQAGGSVVRLDFYQLLTEQEFTPPPTEAAESFVVPCR